MVRVRCFVWKVRGWELYRGVFVSRETFFIKSGSMFVSRETNAPGVVCGLKSFT